MIELVSASFNVDNDQLVKVSSSRMIAQFDFLCSTRDYFLYLLDSNKTENLSNASRHYRRVRKAPINIVGVKNISSVGCVDFIQRQVV